MAAGLGFKTFTTGEVLTAGDVNGYLMQGINVFATTTARDAAITAPAEGQFAFTKDTNSLWYYDGAAWVASGATGDIEGVTAGVGISGGGTSGTVTVTNSMATAIDAKGDLVAGTGADAFARIAVGANNTVLTADSAEATGMKWAAAGSTATISQIATGTLSGATVTISSLSTYDKLFIQFRNVDMSSVTGFSILVNNNTGASNYNWNGFSVNVTTGTGANQAVTRAGFMPYYQGNLPSSAQDNCSGFTLENCKAAGFTTAFWSSFYKNSNANLQAESSQGQYLVAESVSSLVFSANAGTFDGGTYTIWGG
jgi:hypothetical protein